MPENFEVIQEISFIFFLPTQICYVSSLNMSYVVLGFDTNVTFKTKYFELIIVFNQFKTAANISK